MGVQYRCRTPLPVLTLGPLQATRRQTDAQRCIVPRGRASFPMVPDLPGILRHFNAQRRRARRDDSRTQRLARPRTRRADRVHACPAPAVCARL